MLEGLNNPTYMYSNRKCAESIKVGFEIRAIIAYILLGLGLGLMTFNM